MEGVTLILPYQLWKPQILLMLFNDLCPKSIHDLILDILWCVTTKEERSLLFVQLLA